MFGYVGLMFVSLHLNCVEFNHCKCSFSQNVQQENKFVDCFQYLYAVNVGVVLS